MISLTAENVADYAVRRQLFPKPAGDIVVQPLTGGVSCAGFLLNGDQRDGYVVKQALPRLRVDADWQSSPARAEHEFLGLQVAQEIWPTGSAPVPVFYDAENAIVAMTAITPPFTNWKSDLLAGRVDLEIAKQCGQRLAELHRAPQTVGLPAVLANQEFFRELRIEAYLLESARREPESARFLEGLAEDMLANHDSLVHGDFTPKNMLVREGQLVVLDFEVLHLGHFVFDVASLLNHLLLKALHLPAQREELRSAAATFLEEYCLISGVSPAAPILWRCLGGLMLARVVGKSPVQYLAPENQEVARRLAHRLLRGEFHSLSAIPLSE